MLDPRELYEVDAEVRSSLAGRRPVLVHLLEGFIDAGQVGRQLAEHLLASCDAVPLATFDVDQVHDYRSRRPAMVFDTNTWTSVTDHELVLHRLTDAAGEPFLLLTGPEPDSQWQRCVAAVLGLVEELDVSYLLTAQGVPMGVPHTRPVLVTEHATDPTLVPSNPVYIDRVTVPGSFNALLEFRAGQAGRLGRGFVAHVPHYLAAGSYGPAALAVLERIRDLTGLDLPPGDLATLSLQTLSALEEEVVGDGELGPLVARLEEQYDELQASGTPRVPSPDEIGAVVEQFLAEHEETGDDDGAH